MATSTDTAPAPRWDLPTETLERAVAGTLRLRLYRDGAAVTADSTPTCVLYGTDGEAITLGGSVSLNGDTYEQAVSSGEATLAMGRGYRVQWSATVDGVAFTYDRPVTVIRRALYPVVTDLDVRRRWVYLDPGRRGALTAQTSNQAELDAAWVAIMHRLMQHQRYPWMIANPSTFYECHLALAGSYIHSSLGSRGNVRMQDIADQLMREFETAWGRLQIAYDENEDGLPDKPETDAMGGLWLGGAPQEFAWRRGQR